jgi:16S rRNA (adenine1518-N6/adenine1519-N6)-dimethyltransferase
MRNELPPLREVVQNFAIAPQKTLGQNFLFDLNLTSKIARAAGDLSDHPILEIGPGPGGLTRAILEQNPLSLTVIERDERCIGALKQIQEFYPNRLNIIQGDAININEQEIINSKAKIIANLPYNIATLLLFKWLSKLEYFSSLTLMFQKEVADRIVASPNSKEYGRLSIMTQVFCNVSRVLDIHPNAFVPPPKIFSTVVNIIPRIKPVLPVNRLSLELICKYVFNQRRKTLRSSLKQLTSNPEALLEHANISANLRPEDLTIEQFCILSNSYDQIILLR